MKNDIVSFLFSELKTCYTFQKKTTKLNRISSLLNADIVKYFDDNIFYILIIRFILNH